MNPPDLRTTLLAWTALLLLAAGPTRAEEKFDRVLAEMGAEYYGQLMWLKQRSIDTSRYWLRVRYCKL